MLYVITAAYALGFWNVGVPSCREEAHSDNTGLSTAFHSQPELEDTSLHPPNLKEQLTLAFHCRNRIVNIITDVCTQLISLLLLLLHPLQVNMYSLTVMPCSKGDSCSVLSLELYPNSFEFLITVSS